jgi:hypothetical protein
MYIIPVGDAFRVICNRYAVGVYVSPSFYRSGFPTGIKNSISIPQSLNPSIPQSPQSLLKVFFIIYRIG